MRLFGEDVVTLALQHVVLAVVPVLIGLVISLLLGWWAWRVRAVRRVLVPLTGVLYTIPSLALFVVMPLILGTRILDPLNVVAALVLYAVALLVRSVVDGLDAVPDDVVTAAVAMGYRPAGLFLGVQLPLAVPVLIGGLRVATVSSFSLVAVGAIIGQGALGALFTDGFQRSYTAQIVFGLVAIVVLALVFDAIWVLIGRLVAPWAAARTRGGPVTTRPTAGAGSDVLGSILAWFAAPAQWSSSTGIPARLAEHLGYTALTVVVAALIAIPLGAWIGHTGRGRLLVVGTANGLRALPELGVLVLFVLLIGLGLLPVVLALLLLAVPPLLAGTYSGIASVDPAAVDAARGVGMTEWQILLEVELPNAVPLIVGGLRTATLQVVATATIAAYVSLGGLGRYIVDGQAQRDFVQMAGGAILVALLAIVLELLLQALGRRVTPGRPGSRASRRAAAFLSDPSTTTVAPTGRTAP